jgi:predicted nucleic acid-binding protein
MVVLDTSALVGALAGPRAQLPKLEELLRQGQPLRISALTLYEWSRGARTAAELTRQEALFPAREALPFTVGEAQSAASLYRRLPRARGRTMDIAIAACALDRGAAIWTLNRRDFADIPNLRLV